MKKILSIFSAPKNLKHDDLSGPVCGLDTDRDGLPDEMLKCTHTVSCFKDNCRSVFKKSNIYQYSVKSIFCVFSSFTLK